MCSLTGDEPLYSKIAFARHSSSIMRQETKKAPAKSEASLSVRHKQGGILTTRNSWEDTAVAMNIAAVQHFTRIVSVYLPYQYCKAKKDKGGSIMNSSQNPQEPPCPKPDSEIVINFRHLSIQFLKFLLAFVRRTFPIAVENRHSLSSHWI